MRLLTAVMLLVALWDVAVSARVCNRIVLKDVKNKDWLERNGEIVFLWNKETKFNEEPVYTGRVKPGSPDHVWLMYLNLNHRIQGWCVADLPTPYAKDTSTGIVYSALGLAPSPDTSSLTWEATKTGNGVKVTCQDCKEVTLNDAGDEIQFYYRDNSKDFNGYPVFVATGPAARYMYFTKMNQQQHMGNWVVTSTPPETTIDPVRDASYLTGFGDFDTPINQKWETSPKGNVKVTCTELMATAVPQPAARQGEVPHSSASIVSTQGPLISEWCELPAPWKHADVGNVKSPGAACYLRDLGEFSIASYGYLKNLAKPSYHFVYLEIPAFTLDVRLVMVARVSRRSSSCDVVGLMVSSSLNSAFSPYISLAAHHNRVWQAGCPDQFQSNCSQGPLNGSERPLWLRVTLDSGLKIDYAEEGENELPGQWFPGPSHPTIPHWVRYVGLFTGINDACENNKNVHGVQGIITKVDVRT